MEEFFTTIERHKGAAFFIAMFILFIVGELVAPIIRNNQNKNR